MQKIKLIAECKKLDISTESWNNNYKSLCHCSAAVKCSIHNLEFHGSYPIHFLIPSYQSTFYHQLFPYEYSSKKYLKIFKESMGNLNEIILSNIRRIAEQI